MLYCEQTLNNNLRSRFNTEHFPHAGPGLKIRGLEEKMHMVAASCECAEYNWHRILSSHFQLVSTAIILFTNRYQDQGRGCNSEGPSRSSGQGTWTCRCAVQRGRVLHSLLYPWFVFYFFLSLSGYLKHQWPHCCTGWPRSYNGHCNLFLSQSLTSLCCCKLALAEL